MRQDGRTARYITRAYPPRQALKLSVSNQNKDRRGPLHAQPRTQARAHTLVDQKGWASRASSCCFVQVSEFRGFSVSDADHELHANARDRTNETDPRPYRPSVEHLPYLTVKVGQNRTLGRRKRQVRYPHQPLRKRKPPRSSVREQFPPLLESLANDPHVLEELPELFQP